MAAKSKEEVPYRQIRAVYDEETITVYQAYSPAIAEAAVREQKLCASKQFSFDRFTWIKPSWCWMMYRSGYALKDSRQTRILALKISHASLRELLMSAAVCRGKTPFSTAEKMCAVRVQWDPERSPKLGVLPYRSIQIGIGRSMRKTWRREFETPVTRGEKLTEINTIVKEFSESMVISIEDVTDRAAKMREVLGKNGEAEVNEAGQDPKRKWEQKEKAKREDFTIEQLIELGVMPKEVEYVVDEELRKHLRMDGGADS